MQLEEYANTKSINLSAGNKKKLSICISLIGNSSIQFFDEPSRGLDPIAQKYLWYTLQKRKEPKFQSSIIITTKSVKEAEYLCNKIGLVNNGQLKWNHTIDDIPSRIQGYHQRLILKLGQQANHKVVDQQIRPSISEIPQNQVFTFDKQKNQLTYEINDNNLTLTKVSQYIKNQRNQDIIDFSLECDYLQQLFSQETNQRMDHQNPKNDDYFHQIASVAYQFISSCCCCIEFNEKY